MEGTGEAIEKIGWGSSYRCSSGISYQLEGTMMGTARMTFQYIHVQVFNFTTPGEFSSGTMKDCTAVLLLLFLGRECGSDSDSDTLYIALGAGIGGGLVLILLLILVVGYLYWSTRRRRNYTPISK